MIGTAASNKMLTLSIYPLMQSNCHLFRADCHHLITIVARTSEGNNYQISVGAQILINCLGIYSRVLNSLVRQQMDDTSNVSGKNITSGFSSVTSPKICYSLMFN
ncbi:unnamed protein product [Meganyctiphanes norvegica]|uniref:Uncharacterized protein n=1 Tax=Meganyctiphanes norvegica TaxID=48144 RepID=A0AAV2S8V1_MEGNR